MTAFIAGSAQVSKIAKEKSASEAMNNILDALPCSLPRHLSRRKSRKEVVAITR